MGVVYVPLSDPSTFLSEGLDVILFSVSIMSFEDTLKAFLPHVLAQKAKQNQDSDAVSSPLFVDVLSVKEHPRKVMLDLLPTECDILCTHPMFGPVSGASDWNGLKFVYEVTRLNGIVLHGTEQGRDGTLSLRHDYRGKIKQTQDWTHRRERLARFLTIWDKEGCNMIPLSCLQHDIHAANSQFITHLLGRSFGEHNLQSTPIDTEGFERVMAITESVNADSFDLFYGLFRYNRHAVDVLVSHRQALDNVIRKLQAMDDEKRPLLEQNVHKRLKRQRSCLAYTL